jgi:hypothetical protein
MHVDFAVETLLSLLVDPDKKLFTVLAELMYVCEYEPWQHQSPTVGR